MKKKILAAAMLSVISSVSWASLTVEWLDGSSQTEAISKVGRIELIGDQVKLVDLQGNVLATSERTKLRKISFVENGTVVENHLSDAKISVYPNPTTDVLYIKGLEEGEEVRLFDAEGRMLKSTQSAEMDMEDVATGVYFLQVRMQVLKVIKK